MTFAVLSLFDVHLAQVDGGQVALKQRDARLGHRHRKRQPSQDLKDVERAGGEVEQVQRGVEELVAHTHEEQDGPRRVVQLHDGVALGRHELVTRLALQEAGVQVEPVTTHVDDHGHDEPEGPLGVERAQDGQEGGRGAAIRQHVQHGAEFRGLIEGAGGVTVEGVEKCREDVTRGRDHVVALHEPEAHDGQEDSRVAD